MCTAAFQDVFAKAGKLDLAGRISNKTDAQDPLMKSLGYSGIMNPAEEIKHKIAGTQSDVTKKSIAQGLASQTKRHQASSVTGVSGHVQSIAARKARMEF